MSYQFNLFLTEVYRVKQGRVVKFNSAGTEAAEKRLQTRAVRSYEVEHIHSLWHLDYHQGSGKILILDGRGLTPMLLAIDVISPYG